MDDRRLEATRLWTLAQPAVSAFIGAVVREIRDRDDILQQVAVAFMISFESYDRARPLLPWLIGIARNEVGSYLRLRSREQLVFDPDALDQLEMAFSTIQPREVRMLDYLDECLQLLNGRSRTLCEMRYGRDLKPAAIAPLVGMPPNGVAKSLQRIREMLRECVERRAALDGF